MATQPLDVNKCRGKLNPVHAEFLEGSESRSVLLDNAKELRIGFRYSTTDNIDELERFLQLYTWPTNTEERRYVDGFSVAGVPVEGVWRQAFVSRIERMDSSRQTEFLLVVTLRRGWATSLNWDEALMMQWRETDGNGKNVPEVANTASIDKAQAIVVRFPNVSPAHIKAVMSQTPATVTGGTVSVQGVSLSETWHRAFAVCNRQEDGTGFVDLSLTRNRFTVELYNNAETPAERTLYRIYDVPRAAANTITDAWKGPGRSADISLNQDRDLCVVSLWSNTDNDDEFSTLAATTCSFYTVRTVVTNAAAPVGVPDNAMGITYRSSFQIDPQSGLYSGWVEETVRQSQMVGPYRSVNTHGEYVETTDYSGLYEIQGVLYYKRLKKSTEGGIEEASSDTVLLPVDGLPKGKTWDVQKRTNEDCTLDVTIRERTEKEIADLQYRSAQSAAAESTTTEKYNQETVPVVEASPGKVVRVGVRYNKQTGLLDAEGVETEVVNQTGASTSDNTFESLAESVNTQADNALAPAVSASGVIREHQSRPTEAGKHSTSARARTAKQVTDAQKTQSANTFESVERDTIRNKAGAARSALSASGAIETVTVEKSEFPDRVHDTLERRTATEVADAQKAETETKFEAQHSDTTRNAETPRTVTIEAGKIKTQRVEKSEFPDRVHDTLEERTAKPVSDAQKTTQVDAFSKAASSTDRNQDDPAPAETTQTPGFIKRATAQLNDFDRYDNTVEEREAITRENTGGTVTATTYETQDGSSARNLVNEPMPDATESGKIKSFRKSLNDMLRWDKEGTERTAVTVADAQKEETKSIFEDTVSDTVRNKSGVAREAAEIEGEIQTVRVEKSEFPDRIHDTLMRRIAKAVLGFLKGYRDTAAMAEETTGDRNAVEPLSLVAVDTAAGKITEVQSERNQYGRWDRRKVERTTKNQSSTDTQDGHLSSTEIIKNTQANAPETRTAAAGERVSVQNQETEFGKHSTAVLVETAIAQETIDYDKTALSNRTTTRKWNADKVTSPPTRPEGHTVALVQSPTPFKDKWDVVSQDEASEPWDTGWVSVPSFNGLTRVRAWGNQSGTYAGDVAATLNDATVNSVNPGSKNRFGRYDGSATSREPDNTTNDNTFWQSTQTKEDIYTEEKLIGNVPHTRQLKRTRKYSVNQTYLGAKTAADIYLSSMPSVAVMPTHLFGVISSNGRVGYEASVTWIEPQTAWQPGESLPPQA